MSFRVGVFALAFFAVAASAQRTAPSHYGSFTGFGNINFPGVGHPPNVVYPNAFWGMNGRPGGTMRGNSMGYGYGMGAYSGTSGMSRTNRRSSYRGAVIVPVPVIFGAGGGYYPYDPSMYADPGYVQEPQQQVTPSVVIINQGYRPETLSQPRYYEVPAIPENEGAQPQPRPVQDDKPTLYLIAFQDHTILPSLAYWVEGDTLAYITEQGNLNRTSLSLIDKTFSKQLNRERSVEFSLPE
jgi:hypothetical protein